jgi:hypothetical protein
MESDQPEMEARVSNLERMRKLPGCGSQVAFLKAEPRAARPDNIRPRNGSM